MTASAVSTFPITIDAPQAPTQFDNLATPNVEHDLLHDWAQDAIKKIEAKLGITSSPDNTSVDYVLKNHQHQGTDRSAQFAAIPIKMVASQVPNPLEVRTSTGVLQNAITPAGEFLDVGATAATLAYRSNVSGDTQDRWVVQADGTMKWGPGGAIAPDVTLARISASALKITGSLQLSTPLAIAQGGTGSATQPFVDLTAAQTVAGLKTLSAGLSVTGSPSGYGAPFGEVTAPQLALSTTAVGSPVIYFDHRAASNTGTWAWRNGTTAGTTQMALGGTGILAFSQTPGTTHESSRVAGTAQMFGARGLGVSADLATFQGGVTAGFSVAINRTDPAVSINNASGPLFVGYAGATQKFSMDQLGQIKAAGDDNRFGTGALGATGSHVRLHGDPGAGFAAIYVESSSVNADLYFVSKGGGIVYFQTGGVNKWYVDASGNLVGTGNGGSGPTFTGSGVLALRNAGTNPFATPASGGVLYASAGALRWRGSSGTDTQIAAA